MKQTFLYAVCGVILVTAFSGCAGINSLLKSGQPELIYSKALEYYQKEKWSRASTLFEGVQHYYIGTPREDSVSFFNARCKFKNRDYDTASSAAAPSSKTPKACTHSASTTSRPAPRATRR